MPESAINTDFIAGLALGIVIGCLAGYLIWRTRKSEDDAITKLSGTQVVGALLTAGYIFFPSILNIASAGKVQTSQPDTGIAIALIALIASESAGLLAARALEKSPSVKEKR